MKALIPLLVVVVGVLCIEYLNEDELRDQANYVANKRSKRALCGERGRVTTRAPPRPTWYRYPPIRPSYCYSCSCYRYPRPVISKRVAVHYCDYNRCCRSMYPWRNIAKGASASAAKSVNVKSMASSLITKFGKRASGDSKFKKPSVDLVFLIDDSGSIKESQFKVAKEGTATLSQALCPHKFGSGKGEKQVSVVLFSTTSKTVMTYQQSQKGAGYVENTILNMKQRHGATSTTDAIKHVREKILTQPGSRLNDPNTATIVFVVTDGKCNNGCDELKYEAKKLRESGPGVQVFAFGVGEADCLELEDIRGKDSGDVFGLPDYNFFEKMANAVKEQMAKSGDKICVK